MMQLSLSEKRKQSVHSLHWWNMSTCGCLLLLFVSPLLSTGPYFISSSSSSCFFSSLLFFRSVSPSLHSCICLIWFILHYTQTQQLLPNLCVVEREITNVTSKTHEEEKKKKKRKGYFVDSQSYADEQERRKKQISTAKASPFHTTIRKIVCNSEWKEKNGASRLQLFKQMLFM